MENKRKYHIIIGARAYFDKSIEQISQRKDARTLMELVLLFDRLKLADLNIERLYKERTSLLIVKNNNYHGIAEAAHDRLGALIEEITNEDADIYVHNPPRVLSGYLQEQFDRGIIELEVDREIYKMENDRNMFTRNMELISSNIIGQPNAIKEIAKSIWYLTVSKRIKPYVVMLYGNSSVGKTELVKEVAERFFSGKYLEKHLSMFKNDNYSYYFFGDAPNRKSLGFDLLERESNLVFFDELDKCPEHFYSAFYTLFDSEVFKDATYDVNIAGLIIILTSNYHSEAEMKERLGLPIFNRIDKMICFKDFDANTIHDITMKEIKAREAEFADIITAEKIYLEASELINSTGENARTIRNKVQKVIEEMLFDEVEKTI